MRKAFILGAGLGTRLRPLTNTLPKPLIPLHNRPLVTHALDHCLAAGLTDIAINTHHLPEAWERAFPDKRYKEASLSFFHEPELLETGGGIKNIESWIAGESLLIYNGDILTDLSLRELIATHQAGANTATLALRDSGPALHIATDGSRITDIHQKVTGLPGTHQFTGLYCVEPELLSLIPPHEKISVIPAFLELIKANKLGAHLANDATWLDLGTRCAYLEAAFARKAKIHPSARISPSARIENSWIGADCQVYEQAVITNSILWPGTEVLPAARLDHCIVHSPQAVHGQHEDSDL
ncbi:MAG: sugar phosphate nucleotidyltransferase [Verrucomicrobiales bacterium]